MAKHKKRMWAEVAEVWAHRFQDGLNFETKWFVRLIFPDGRETNVEIHDETAQTLIKK